MGVATKDYLKALPLEPKKVGDFTRPDMTQLDTVQKVIDKAIELGFTDFCYVDKFKLLATRCLAPTAESQEALANS